VSLPTSISDSAYNVLVGNEIVFLSMVKQVRRWNIETNAIITQKFAGDLPANQLASNAPAVCVRNYAYFVHQDTGEVCTFNLISFVLAYL